MQYPLILVRTRSSRFNRDDGQHLMADQPRTYPCKSCALQLPCTQALAQIPGTRAGAAEQCSEDALSRALNCTPRRATN